MRRSTENDIFIYHKRNPKIFLKWMSQKRTVFTYYLAWRSINVRRTTESPKCLFLGRGSQENEKDKNLPSFDT